MLFMCTLYVCIVSFSSSTALQSKLQRPTVIDEMEPSCQKKLSPRWAGDFFVGAAA